MTNKQLLVIATVIVLSATSAWAIPRWLDQREDRANAAYLQKLQSAYDRGQEFARKDLEQLPISGKTRYDGVCKEEFTDTSEIARCYEGYALYADQMEDCVYRAAASLRGVVDC
jgi:type II secretory pathway pseudopilin PulG